MVAGAGAGERLAREGTVLLPRHQGPVQRHHELAPADLDQESLQGRPDRRIAVADADLEPGEGDLAVARAGDVEGVVQRPQLRRRQSLRQAIEEVQALLGAPARPGQGIGGAFAGQEGTPKISI